MLYIVPTPIGNLEDITLRAIRILGEVDYVLAEDTRVTGKLLKHLEINQTIRTFHAHNEHARLDEILKDLEAGTDIALVGDAGTPGISDPGYLLVRECAERNIPVTCLPGPTAIIPAVVLSAFPVDAFSFIGFLPHKKGRQTRWLEIAADVGTQVIYESPHRLVRFLKEASRYLQPDRSVAVVREISKIHEEVHRGTASELLTFFENTPSKAKGEIVIVIGRSVTGKR